MSLGRVGTRQSVACFGHRNPERPDLCENRLLGNELLLLVESCDGCRGDLVELKAEKTDRAGKHPRIATEVGEAGVNCCELLSRLGKRLEVGAGKDVQRLSLCGLVEQ